MSGHADHTRQKLKKSYGNPLTCPSLFAADANGVIHVEAATSRQARFDIFGSFLQHLLRPRIDQRVKIKARQELIALWQLVALHWKLAQACWQRAVAQQKIDDQLEDIAHPCEQARTRPALIVFWGSYRIRAVRIRSLHRL